MKIHSDREQSLAFIGTGMSLFDSVIHGREVLYVLAFVRL